MQQKPLVLLTIFVSNYNPTVAKTIIKYLTSERNVDRSNRVPRHLLD